MKLFYLPGACSMVPHTALQWIGQPYEAEAVTHAQTKEPAYPAMNPQGAVPLLVDGDLVLSQNVAILAYRTHASPKHGCLVATPSKARPAHGAGWPS
ncbi:glutathione S-transferase N-terminal domain-containing protein [Lautropia mirabilis]